MKTYIIYLGLVSLLAFMLPQRVQAQDTKYTFKQTTGFGYFDPMASGEKGNLFFTKLVVKTNTDLFIGLGIGSSLIFSNADQFMGNERTRFYENYYLYNLYLERHFFLNREKDHILSIGTGIVYEEVKSAEPRVYYNYNGLGEEELVAEIKVSNRNQNNAGTFLEIDYSYFKNHVGIGVRVKTHFLLDIGFGGIIITPTISVRF